MLARDGGAGVAGDGVGVCATSVTAKAATMAPETELRRTISYFDMPCPSRRPAFIVQTTRQNDNVSRMPERVQTAARAGHQRILSLQSHILQGEANAPGSTGEFTWILSAIVLAAKAIAHK